MERIKEILRQYKGKLTEEPGKIVFTNPNILTDYWGKKKCVVCKIEIHKSFIVDPKRYSVTLEEKTLKILGGSGCGNLTEKEAIERVEKGLERYCFTRNENEQLRLF